MSKKINDKLKNGGKKPDLKRKDVKIGKFKGKKIKTFKNTASKIVTNITKENKVKINDKKKPRDISLSAIQEDLYILNKKEKPVH